MTLKDLLGMLHHGEKQQNKADRSSTRQNTFIVIHITSSSPKTLHKSVGQHGP